MKKPSIAEITKAIVAHPDNAAMRDCGYKPVFSAHPDASLLIIGQAPGIKAQLSEKPWNDKSGEQLRRWMGVDETVFYNERKVALVPMDFYFPGKGKSGDLPPRKGFAGSWHPAIFETLKNVRLTLLVGQYSQAYYLKKIPESQRARTLTETVRHYQNYLNQQLFPLPHPSPRNNIWKAKNPWFEEEVVPVLRQRVAALFMVQ